jgi:hypothetical protein
MTHLQLQLVGAAPTARKHQTQSQTPLMNRLLSAASLSGPITGNCLESLQRSGMTGAASAAAGFEDLQRLVEEANVQRAAAGEQPICIPDSLTLQAYQTKFNRSAAAGGSRKRGRSGASSRQLATQAVPPAPPQQQQLQQQQQRQQASGGGQGRQPAVGARTAANGSSAHASVDDGSGDSAQEDAAPIDLVGARLAVMALIRHMFAVLGKFPWLQLFIAADFPGNKLLMDGG